MTVSSLWLRSPKKSLRRTTLFSVCSIALLSGLAVARLGVSMPGWCVLVISTITCLLLRKPQRSAVVLVLLMGISVGLWRGSIFMDRLQPYQQLYGHSVTILVRAQSDGVYDGPQISFDAGSIEVMSPHQRLPGKMTIKGRGASAIFNGDALRVTGKLYKTRGSSQAGMSFATIELLHRNIGFFDTLRLRFSAGVRNALPEPQASFGIGLLIGQKTALPKTVSDDLSRVGLTHIIAVSGYNLTIIIELARRKLGKRSKYQATVWSLLLMASFLLVTGFGASIVRAAIVSTLSLAAWYYGRTIRPVLLIGAAAALTAYWYPLYLWSDIGWYLSFLAFFGVLVVAPIIVARVDQKGKRANTVRLLVIESFCAQLMTLPIIMYIFHRLSVIGLLSNLLVVPLVPLGMLCSLWAGLCGLVLPSISGWVGVPGRYVLSYMLDLTHILAAWPHASIEQQISSRVMVLLYALILAVVVFLWRITASNDRLTDTELSEKMSEQ